MLKLNKISVLFSYVVYHGHKATNQSINYFDYICKVNKIYFSKQ